MDKDSIGYKIRILRQNKKLTQEKLAEKADLSQQHISRIEKGTVEPEYQTIYKLAFALDVSVDTLIENQFKKNENELVYELMQKLDYLSDDDINQLLGYADCLIERQRIRKRILWKDRTIIMELLILGNKYLKIFCYDAYAVTYNRGDWVMIATRF